MHLRGELLLFICHVHNCSWTKMKRGKQIGEGHRICCCSTSKTRKRVSECDAARRAFYLWSATCPAGKRRPPNHGCCSTKKSRERVSERDTAPANQENEPERDTSPANQENEPERDTAPANQENAPECNSVMQHQQIKEMHLSVTQHACLLMMGLLHSVQVLVGWVSPACTMYKK